VTFQMTTLSIVAANGRMRMTLQSALKIVQT
jgi:hypothetical protein